MLKTLLLHLIAFCNINSSTNIQITHDLRYTIIVNDIIVLKDEAIPEWFFQDMTDFSEEDEDFIPGIDVTNLTINIKTSK